MNNRVHNYAQPRLWYEFHHISPSKRDMHLALGIKSYSNHTSGRKQLSAGAISIAGNVRVLILAFFTKKVI